MVWIKASSRSNWRVFPANRSPKMTYKSFRRIIDTTTIRRDYLKDDSDWHGLPTVALSRSVKIAVQPHEARAYYYRDRPFMTLAGYERFLTIDVSRFPRLKSVLKTVRKLMEELPTNIEIGELKDGVCCVRTKLADQEIEWRPNQRSISFHSYKPRLQGPGRRLNFEHDPTRYYTPEEKELWAWADSNICSSESVSLMELACEQAASIAAQKALQEKVDKLV